MRVNGIRGVKIRAGLRSGACSYLFLLHCFILLGIGNVEEFSLLVEGQKEEREDVDKAGTIKRVCFLLQRVKSPTLYCPYFPPVLLKYLG